MYNKVLVFILCLYLSHQMKYLSGNVNQTFTIANTKAAFIHNFDPSYIHLPSENYLAVPIQYVHKYT